MVGGPRGRSRVVGKVAVSLARPRRRPAWRRRRRARGRGPSSAAAIGLGGSRSCRTGPGSRACRRAARPRRRRAGRRRPSRTPSAAAARRGPRASPATAWRKTLRRRLAEDRAPGPRSRTRARRRTPPASSVSPFGVSHHGLRCIARSSAPPRTSRKATSMFRYDRSSPASPMTTAATVPGGAASASSAVEQRLAVELAARVVGGEHEQRPAGVARRGVGGRGRRPGDDPVRVDRQAALREPAGERLAVELREVRHDPERDAALPGAPRPPRPPRAAARPGGRGRRRHRARGRAPRAAPSRSRSSVVIRRW